MKRTLLAIVAAFVMITSANAQRLTDIQAGASFITDKMIVELGLSNVQRNSLLNINLNYLDGIRSYRDIDAYGWHYRNKQLKRMLNDRQWKRFKEAYYFYHPIGWLEQQHLHIQHIQQVSQAQLSSQPPSPALLRQARQAVQVRQEVEARQETLRERIQALQEALRERIQIRQEALRERIQARQEALRPRLQVRQALQARQARV